MNKSTVSGERYLTVILKTIIIVTTFLFFSDSNIYAEISKCNSQGRETFKYDLNKGSFSLFTSIYKQVAHLKEESIWNNSTIFNASYNELKSYFSCANNYIKSQAGSINIPAKYGTYVNDLEKIMNSFTGSFYVTRNSKIDESDLDALNKNLIKTNALYTAALHDIKNEPQGLTFTKKTKEEIFPKYKKFFELYSAFKGGRKSLNPDELRYFLSMEDLIEPDLPETVVNFLVRLETFKDLLSYEKKKSWFGTRSLQTMIIASQEIIDTLHQLYPELKVVTTIATSRNEPAVIILSEAGALYILLQHLKKEAELRLRKVEVKVIKGG